MILSNDCWLKERCKRYQDYNCDNDVHYCKKLFKLNELYNETLLPIKQRGRIELKYDGDGTDGDKFKQLHLIEDDIENFIKGGNNLFIYSKNPGNGKTSWAIRFIQDYFETVWYKTNMECKALFINVPRFLLALKDNISEKNDYVAHIKENILKADLVIWDDIATKTITDFEAENLLTYIDARISDGKSNIFTSNMVPKEIDDLMGGRLASRIANNSICVELHGKDKRSLNRVGVGN